jgi:hypothetical protein
VELKEESALEVSCACMRPRFPAMLADAGFQNVQMIAVQLAGTEGEVKLISPIMMENIADAVIAEGFASKPEIDQLVAELYEFARIPSAIGCMPRVVGARGKV